MQQAMNQEHSQEQRVEQQVPGNNPKGQVSKIQEQGRGQYQGQSGVRIRNNGTSNKSQNRV